MSIFIILLQYELRLQLAKLNAIITNCLYFVILSIIFILISQNFSDNSNITQYLVAIILFSIVSAAIFSNSNFLKDDFIDGSIEQIIRKINNFEIYIFAKIIAQFISHNLPIIISSPLILIIGKANLEISNFIIILTSYAFLINSISCFSGSLSILKNNSALCALITLPLIIPVLILAFSQITNPENNLTRILIFLAIFATSIATIATAKITKICLE